jgi:hypothetical protein
MHADGEVLYDTQAPTRKGKKLLGGGGGANAPSSSTTTNRRNGVAKVRSLRTRLRGSVELTPIVMAGRLERGIQEEASWCIRHDLVDQHLEREHQRQLEEAVSTMIHSLGFDLAARRSDSEPLNSFTGSKTPKST